MKIHSLVKLAEKAKEQAWSKNQEKAKTQERNWEQEKRSDRTSGKISDKISDKFIGIDIGTTKCRVAVIENDRPVVIPVAEGGRSIASVISFSKSGELLIGEAAKRQIVTNAKRTIHSINKVMGSEKTYYIDGTEYKPHDFYVMLLQILKQDAEQYLGERVDKAVIAVPSYFNSVQRKTVKRAAEQAGFTLQRIINESSAAAMTYGFFVKEDQRIMVYNLGGGCFDISGIDISDNVVEVIATSSNSNLGGNDFDDRIVQWVLAEFKKTEGVDLTNDKMALQRVREAAEKAKIELSTETTTNINLPFITATVEGPKHVNMNLTREKFEELIRDLIDRTKSSVEEIMKTAVSMGYTPKHIFLTGGSTCIPAIQEMIKQVTKVSLRKSSNPEESVVMGAAIMGAKLAGERSRVGELMLLEVLSQSLAIETAGGVATRLIEKNTTIPTKKTQIFSTAADNQIAVDINILQGEGAYAKDNKSIGAFRLDGILPAKKGVPRIEVTFEIDPNGILNVSAKDLGTGRNMSVKVNV